MLVMGELKIPPRPEPSYGVFTGLASLDMGTVRLLPPTALNLAPRLAIAAVLKTGFRI